MRVTPVLSAPKKQEAFNPNVGCLFREECETVAQPVQFAQGDSNCQYYNIVSFRHREKNISSITNKYIKNHEKNKTL